MLRISAVFGVIQNNVKINVSMLNVGIENVIIQNVIIPDVAILSDVLLCKQ